MLGVATTLLRSEEERNPPAVAKHDLNDERLTRETVPGSECRQGGSIVPIGVPGWQRATRPNARQPPRTPPCFRTVARPYAEQVG